MNKAATMPLQTNLDVFGPIEGLETLFEPAAFS